MLEQRALRFAFTERFHPGMIIPRLLTFAAIAGSIALILQSGAACAMASNASASGATDVERAPIILAQYEGIPNGKPGWPGGPAWQGGPEWRQAWPSTWGGGWYGGWYQPYWGTDAWASPYWYYGHPDYYGGSPGLCSSGHCWQQQPAPDYTPQK
jgi:hypothetical protein